MRVFVTGASGWIGSATVPELLANGHEVIGLARSDASAVAVADAGATVQRGSLDDLASLRAGAEAADAVIHLAFIHDFANFAESVAADRRAIDAMAEALAGTDKPLAIASGLLGVVGADGGPATEGDGLDVDPAQAASPRQVTADATLALADRGIRSTVVRLPPTVHGTGDPGFIANYVQVARERGAAGTVGDGANRWPAVHVGDAARLFRLAIEQAPAGTVVHANDEQGVPFREIAATVGRGLDVPVTEVAPEAAGEHFGPLGMFYAMDAPASSAVTRERFGWQPAGPTLLEDLAADHYLSPAAHAH